MASLAEAFVQTFLPARCQLCEAPLPWRGSRGGVCSRCWADVTPHRGDPCPRCGNPEAVMHPCFQCRTAPPPWAAAASFSAYEGALRSLILLLKDRRLDELAAPLADLLVAAFRRTGWPVPDVVVPVPTTWERILRRGFDPARLLAAPLAAAFGAPLVPALRRHGRARQVGKPRTERLQLPASAVSARRRVNGRALLVDDVLTTGATATRCTRVLLAAGADEVFVLTLARTPSARRVP